MAERSITTEIQPYPEQETRDSRLEGFRYTSREFFDALNATDSIPMAMSRWEMTGFRD